MKLRNLTAILGSEVEGLDLAKPLSETERGDVLRALHSRLLLVFRGQPLDEAQHIEFARNFAEVHYPPVPTRHGGPPEINVLDQVTPRGEGADLWHHDNTYLESPPMGSILRAVKIPAIGGDTCFANMVAAYAALSPALRSFIDRLHAEHDLTRQLEKAVRRGNSEVDIEATRKRYPPVVHPLVRIHPETGARSLFANRNATTRVLGLAEEESDRLLGLLFRHVNRPEFQCRLRWEEGTVAFFDNRCVQHYAVPDYDERRIMHRITLRGERPVGPTKGPA